MDATNAELRRLREENGELKAQVAVLMKEVAKLEAQLAVARKNSGNSSKTACPSYANQPQSC